MLPRSGSSFVNTTGFKLTMRVLQKDKDTFVSDPEKSKFTPDDTISAPMGGQMSIMPMFLFGICP